MSKQLSAATPVGWIVALLGSALILAPLGQTIYSPSMAIVRDDFGTTNALVGASVSVYGLGLALSQIIYGPLVDRYDAKLVLLAGVSLYVTGAAFGFVAPTIQLLILCRGLQAVGVGAALVVGPAVIGDLVPTQHRGAAMGTFQSITLIGPVLGPLAGSAIVSLFTWRADFVALAIAGLTSGSLVLRFLPRHRANITALTREEVLKVLFTPTTIGCGLLGCAQFVTLHGYIAFLPVLFRDRFQLPESAIGPALLSLTLSMAAGSVIGGRLSDRLGRRTVLLIGSLGAIFGTAAVVAVAMTAQPGHLLPAIGSLMLLGAALSLNLPTQISLLVDWFPHLRGTAVAVYNVLRFTGGAAGPLLAGLMADHFGISWAFSPAVVAVALAFIVAIFAVHNPLPAARTPKPEVVAEAGAAR